jgi:hypothetical protein
MPYKTSQDLALFLSSGGTKISSKGFMRKIMNDGSVKLPAVGFIKTLIGITKDDRHQG